MKLTKCCKFTSVRHWRFRHSRLCHVARSTRPAACRSTTPPPLDPCALSFKSYTLELHFFVQTLKLQHDALHDCNPPDRSTMVTT